MENPYLAMEQQRATLPILGPRKPRKRRAEPDAAVVREMNRRRVRGKRGEQEVARLYRRYGWPDARRQPSSGAWRVDGMPPMPLDVVSGWPAGWPEDRRVPVYGPWAAEVKFSTDMDRPGRGWPGEAFVRATIKETEALRPFFPPTVLLCVWGRGTRGEWRIFVPMLAFTRAVGAECGSSGAWVELGVREYFGVVAEQVLRA